MDLPFVFILVNVYVRACPPLGDHRGPGVMCRALDPPVGPSLGLLTDDARFISAFSRPCSDWVAVAGTVESTWPRIGSTHSGKGARRSTRTGKAAIDYRRAVREVGGVVEDHRSAIAKARTPSRLPSVPTQP